MNTSNERELLKLMLDIYPNKVYPSISELKKFSSLYSVLEIQAKESNLTVTKLLNKLDFEKLNKYDSKRMIEITEEYDFIQSDFSVFFNKKRQAINLIFKKETINSNYFWRTKQFSEEEKQYLREYMIKEKKWELVNDNTGVKYRLLTNFNKAKNLGTPQLSLLAHIMDEKLVTYNELKNSELWVDLKENGYLNFSEDNHKKIHELSHQIMNNLEPDNTINSKLKYSLDSVLKGSTFETRSDLINYLGFNKVLDYKDKRFADEERFKDILNQYVVDENNVKIPANSTDYGFLANNASRNNMNLKEFIESFGYNYISTRDTEETQKRIKHNLSKRNFKGNFVYIDSIDPLYNSLASSAYKMNLSLKDYIREKYGYEQKKLRELGDEVELYDWTQEVFILDQNQIKDLIEEAMVDGKLKIETSSSLYIELNRYARSAKLTPKKLLNHWQFNYQYVYNKENERIRIDEILSDLESLNSSIRQMKESRNKIKRNKLLVQKLKKLYGDSCQICSEKNHIPLIIMQNGQNYVEVHHIKPISSFNEESAINDESNQLVDHYKNCLVVCPHHHKYIHFQDGGYMKLIKEGCAVYLVADKNKKLMISKNHHL